MKVLDFIFSFFSFYSKKGSMDTTTKVLFGGILIVLMIAFSPLLFGDVVFGNETFLDSVPLYIVVIILVGMCVAFVRGILK